MLISLTQTLNNKLWLYLNHITTSNFYPIEATTFVYYVSNQRSWGLEILVVFTNLVEQWSGVITLRNRIVHQVSDDILGKILLFCNSQLCHVIERAFRSLWDIFSGDWDKATPVQKARL